MPYGALTDHFGIAAAGILLQSSSNPKKYNVDATVTDENGDVACRTKTDLETEYSCTYALTSGNSVSIDDLAKVGAVVGTLIQVTAIDGTTSNKAFPTITVKGALDHADAGVHPTFTSGISVMAKKVATPLGIGSITGKTTASSFSISGGMVTVQNELGVTVKREPDGVRVVAQNTLQTCTGAAAASAASGWAVETPLSSDEVNNDYGSSTIAVYKDITRDAEA